MTSVRPASADEWAACYEIAAGLPLYFSATGLEILQRDLEKHETLVAQGDGVLDGFISLDRKSAHIWEISWLAVRADVQGQNVGSALIESATAHARGEGARVLEVKTLAERDRPSNYDATRRFYERQGFALLEVIDPMPGWDPGNPCAIYVKALA